ncbi:hypothetical protein A2U01_0039456, partial [Trifolium medium]|nr:hypothetical protein [Trifolium medium]
MDRNILDAAGGGDLVDKTPAAAKSLIENMSLNSQQFTTRSNEIQASAPNKAIETRLDELTSLLKEPSTSAVWKSNPRQLQLPLPQPAQPTPPPKVTTSEPSLEDIVKQLAAQNIQFQQQLAAQSGQNTQFQQTTAASINNLTTQVG